MRLFLVSAVLAFLALALVPSASAADIANPLDRPCIIYPGYYTVGGGWYGTSDTTVPGVHRDVYFVHIDTDPVTVTGTKVWVPGTTIVTPGVCYGEAVGDLLALLA